MSRNRITHALPAAKTWLERNNRPTDTGPASRSKRYADHPTDLLFVDSVDDTTKEIVMLRHDGFDPNGQHVFRRRSVMSFDTWQRNATHYTVRPEPRSPLTGAAPSVFSAPMLAPVKTTPPPPPAAPVVTPAPVLAPEPTVSETFAQFPGDKASLTKTVAFMLDYLTRANFAGPAKDALHEVRKILSEPTMGPLSLDASVQRANQHLANQGIPMVLTLALLAKLPELARFIDGIDVEIQRICPAYKALLFGGGTSATPVPPPAPPPAMLPAPEALVEEIAKMPLTHAYKDPYAEGGWLGFIEPEDKSWICFCGVDGRALVYVDREPNGQVHGLPAYLYRHDLAHAHIVVSIASLKDGVGSLKEAVVTFGDLVVGLAEEQKKLRETVAAFGSMFPKGVMPIFAGGSASAVGVSPSNGTVNPIGPNGKG